MSTAELVAQEATEGLEGCADKWRYADAVKTVDEDKEARIVLQVVAERTEGAQSLFGLAHEVTVVLKGTESQRVIDVQYRYSAGF